MKQDEENEAERHERVKRRDNSCQESPFLTRGPHTRAHQPRSMYHLLEQIKFRPTRLWQGHAESRINTADSDFDHSLKFFRTSAGLLGYGLCSRGCGLSIT